MVRAVIRGGITATTLVAVGATIKKDGIIITEAFVIEAFTITVVVVRVIVIVVVAFREALVIKTGAPGEAMGITFATNTVAFTIILNTIMRAMVIGQDKFPLRPLHLLNLNGHIHLENFFRIWNFFNLRLFVSHFLLYQSANKACWNFKQIILLVKS